MRKYDVIIIGAGLAGVTLGYLLRKNGKKVLIIEKDRLDNKNKLCGGLLTKKSYNLLCQIFNIDKDIDLEIKEIKKFYVNNKLDKIIIDNTVLFSIYRKRLDDYVIRKYLEIDGEIIDDTRYSKLDLDNNKLMINNCEYFFDYLVGADGVFSQLRKEITRKIQETNFAFEVYDYDISRDLQIYFFNNYKGYAWIIPNTENVMIGLGEVSGKKKIEGEFDSYLKKLNTQSEKKRGTFLPNGNDIYLKYKNIFFVGDSAGLISPITGEGIYYALISSKILSENLNNKYLKKMNAIKRRIKEEKFFLKFVYNDKFRNWLFSSYYKNSFIRWGVRLFIKKLL